MGSLVAVFAMLVVGILILPACVWLVNRPRPYLSGFIFALVLSGVYTVHATLFDVGIVLVAGLAGYVMRFFGFPFLPAVLGVVLGELVESNYRRSLNPAAIMRFSSRIRSPLGFSRRLHCL
jgi:putative tricarboxylic transport membrane protein